MKFYIFGVVGLLLVVVSGFPDGSPVNSCNDPSAFHTREINQTHVGVILPQNMSQSPYKLEISNDTYGPNHQHITVTLNGGAIGETFKGFFIQAIRNNMPLDARDREAYGTFTNITSHAKPNWCENWFEAVGGATHTNNDNKNSVTVIWNAPRRDVGELQFVATAVRNYFQYWVDIRSTPIAPQFPPVQGGRGPPPGAGRFMQQGQIMNPWLGMLMNGFRGGPGMGMGGPGGRPF